MVDQKTSKAAVPRGWELSGGRMLMRKLWFPNAQVMSLYVMHVLVVAARMRVGVTLACSGRCLSVMLLEPSKPRAEASRKLFNFAARLP